MSKSRNARRSRLTAMSAVVASLSGAVVVTRGHPYLLMMIGGAQVLILTYVLVEFARLKRCERAGD